MYAIIETGGKQLVVEEGDTIFVEKLDVEEGTTYTFDKVLFIGDEASKIGAPYVEGATVTAKVLKNGKGKKLHIFTYKPNKTSTRKRQGHRQPYTKVEITKIK